MDNIEKFLEFSESLKLVRKAEAEFEGKSIINEIYTDLLPNNGIINKINLPRTTIVVGRKGTGKSTIFLKSQKDIEANRKYLGIYIDVKSLYDNSTPVFPQDAARMQESQEWTKYLIYSNLIKEIILRTKAKLASRLDQKMLVKFFDISPMILKDVFNELDKIQANIDDVFKNLNSSLVTSFKNTVNAKTESKEGLEIAVNLRNGIGAKAGLSNTESNSIKREFDNTLVTYLDIKNCFIKNLIAIRDLLKIKNLFIYLDDFSEIDKEAQVLFMDWFIAPVNNLSDDFVKFKIAIYPKRFYYGKLDNSKIDEISLDFFDAYYSYEKKKDSVDISRMEELALDYSKRLINNRINIFFPDDHWEQYFSFAPEKLYEILFDVSLNNPRKIGYILSYCYESCLIHKTPITISAIGNAAQRYYSDVIEKYFLVNEHICKPFEDKISNEHQFELLLKIVKRQVHNKEVLKRRRNKETSHFYINSRLAYLMDNLELNGFVSTYNKVKEENNSFSTHYSLDFGLCKKFQLLYSKAGNKKNLSKYLQPLFNFNVLITDFFNSTQIIKCENGHEFPYSQIMDFRKFKMRCPSCLENDIISKCEIEMKFKEFQARIIEQDEKEKIKLTFQEFLMLDYLRLSQKSISVDRLAEAMDITKISAQSNIKKLIDKGMCEYDLPVMKELRKEHVRLTQHGVRTMDKIAELLKEMENSPLTATPG